MVLNKIFMNKSIDHMPSSLYTDVATVDRAVPLPRPYDLYGSCAVTLIFSTLPQLQKKC